MTIPLLIIIGVLILYLLVSYFYCKVVYFSDKEIDKDTAKRYKNIYYIVTFIFAFVILSKFAFEQKITELSFDSAFFIKHYIQPILEKRTLTIEIILSFLVFIVFIFNVYFLPNMLKKSYKITKKTFLKVYYNPKQIYNILPDDKVRNCIYSKFKTNENETVFDLIDTFKALYIEKKVYLSSENSDISKRVLNFEKEIINNPSDCVLLGGAGCGKSTLLFKTFIDIIEDNPEEKKIIPLFVDIKNICDSHSIVDEIIKLNVDLFKKLDGFNYFLNNSKQGDERKTFIKILNQLIKDGYKFIFLFDSLDECNKTNGLKTEFKEFNNLLKGYFKGEESKFKFVIALRESAYVDLKDTLSELGSSYPIYKVRDYDKSEIKLYIEKLVEQNKIDENDIEDIYRNIEIVTFDEKVNPFIVSMIVNGFIKKVRRNVETKVVNILKNNIKGLITDVNESRGTINYHEHTYELIGITTTLQKSKDIATLEKYCEYLNSNVALDEYKEDKKFLKSRTYLIGQNGYFYQKIFADFYSASYLLNTFSHKDNSTNTNYLKIIDEIFSKRKYSEIFEYLVLLTDASEQDYTRGPLNGILDYIFKKFSENKSKEMEKNILEKLEVMLLALIKYSSKKIVKDKLPLDINATVKADDIILYLYEKYFKFLVDNNLSIDYGNFYHIISVIDKHDLAIKAVLKIQATNKKSKDMLSIIRDSYLNLNYARKNILIYNEYKFTPLEKERINEIITSKKAINKLNLRELLNLSFYNDFALDYKDLSIDLQTIYFPRIYNLDLFIENYDGGKKEGSVRVSKKDNLLYDSEESYSSILFLEIEKLNKSKIDISDDVITLYLYSNSNKILSNNIKNTDFIRTVDIDEGVEVLQENCFNKSMKLKNIILPSSLKDIQDFALYECHNLSKLAIPNNVINLGESFIEDCFNLTSVDLPASLKTIGQYAFEDNASLSNINFKFADVELKDGLFKGCMSLTDIESLKLSINTKRIPKQLFLECINLVEADLSKYEQLESIGSYAFARCNNLQKVVLPASLKEVGMLVFYSCNNLQEVVFNSLPKISKQAFAQLNHSIKLVFNLDHKTYEKTFDKCEKINDFIASIKGELVDDKFINGMVFERKADDTYILDYCFEEEAKDFKTSSYLDIKITSCNIGALGNQELINDVEFDENLIELSEWLFEDCYSLYTVNLGTSKIEVLNKHIFENCFVLKEISLPKTLKIIDDYAFENCYEIDKISFNGKASEQNSLVIPSNITSINEFAFHNCKAIKKVTITSNETKIASFAFDGLDNLNKIILPFDYDTKNIEDNAFINCGCSLPEGEMVIVDGINITKREYNRIFGIGK